MLRVIINNVLYDFGDTNNAEKEEKMVELTPDLTLEEIVGIADLSSYYPLGGKYSFNDQYVPYLISNGTINWNVFYNDAKVLDFISTHEIRNNTIVANGGQAQAGGLGYKDLVEIWNNVYPIIDQFVTVVGAGTIMYGTGKWIKSLLYKKEVPPQFYFDLIFSRKVWNHFELSGLLNISADDTKKILNSFGYRYDKAVLMFVQQPKSLELKKKLSEVEVYDR